MFVQLVSQSNKYNQQVCGDKNVSAWPTKRKNVENKSSSCYYAKEKIQRKNVVASKNIFYPVSTHKGRSKSKFYTLGMCTSTMESILHENGSAVTLPCLMRAPIPLHKLLVYHQLIKTFSSFPI